MFPSAYLLILLAQPVGVATRDEMTVTQSAATLDLGWSDAEDRIQGAISPRTPVTDSPFEVTAHVGTFQGAEFSGPVTFSFKPAGSKGGAQTHTVVRAAGERAWRASFRPVEAGEHVLEISFRTTRLKEATAKLNVEEARLPRWPWWIMLGLASAAALGLGVRAALKKPENT